MKKDLLYKEAVVHKSGSLPMKIYQSTYASCHWHEEYEFLISTEATTECTVDGQHYTLQPGEALLIQGGILHSLRLNAGRCVTAIVVHPKLWAGSECAEFFQSLTFPAVFSPQTELGAKVTALLHQILACREQKPYGHEFLVKSHFCALFAALVEAKAYEEQTPAAGYENAAVRRIFEYVHTHYADPITLNSLCELAHYSKAYIIRLFKKHTGQTPTEYVNRYRIERAKELLAATDKTVLDVSLECGFSGVSYFIKTFKQYSGATPHQWRNL